MQDTELLNVLISNEEWQTFECKRAAAQPARLLEAVVAFANAEGGLLVVGLEDPRKAKGQERLVGINENLDNVSDFLKLVEKEITPPIPRISHFELDIKIKDGKPDKLLIARIEKSTDIHSLKHGDTFIRRGRQNVKITADEIIRLKYQKGSLKFADEPAKGISIDELDLELLKKFQAYNKSDNEDSRQFLKGNGLAHKIDGELLLSNAAILLFGRNPSITLKRKCGIKISQYYGKRPSFSATPNLVRKPVSIEGSLISQIKQTISYFQEWVKTSPLKLVGAGFTSSIKVPEWAFQEAVTNAVIHRDYSVQDDIQIRLFDDRVEIESPGTYPGHITVSNIRRERFSRNPIILRTLNRFEDSPNLDIGEGVDRMFSVMKEKNLYDPLYLPPSIRPNSVLVILFNLERIGYWDSVNRYLEDHYKITNQELREITGIRDTLKASRLLKTWVDKGLLEKIGGRSKKIVYYKKPGTEPQAILFSLGVENKIKG